MAKQITLGVDLSAYLTVDLPEETVMTEDNLKAIALQIDDKGSFLGVDALFEEDWSTKNALRILSVKEGSKVFMEGVPVTRSYYDCGTGFSSWMNGVQSLANAVQSFINMAPKQYPGIVEVHKGHITLPGEKTVHVDFECRKGATKEETDLAFLAALSEVAEIGYLAIGDMKTTEAKAG